MRFDAARDYDIGQQTHGLAHLARAGLNDAFDHVVTRDDVPHGKPGPDAFLRAAAKLGMPASACLAVEDSHHGVAAACAAGMPVVLIATGTAEACRQNCAAVAPHLCAIADPPHASSTQAPFAAATSFASS